MKKHGTFEEYCKSKWDISRPRAYELMKAAEVKENLSTTVDISERVVRPLTRIKDPDEQREVYQKAVETAPEGNGRYSGGVVDFRIFQQRAFASQASFDSLLSAVTNKSRVSLCCIK